MGDDDPFIFDFSFFFFFSVLAFFVVPVNWAVVVPVDLVVDLVFVDLVVDLVFVDLVVDLVGDLATTLVVIALLLVLPPMTMIPFCNLKLRAPETSFVSAEPVTPTLNSLDALLVFSAFVSSVNGALEDHELWLE